MIADDLPLHREGNTTFSFHLRVDHRDSGHVHFAVFAGKDKDHRAKTGDLVMTPAEFEDFAERLRPDLVSEYPRTADAFGVLGGAK